MIYFRQHISILWQKRQRTSYMPPIGIVFYFCEGCTGHDVRTIVPWAITIEIYEMLMDGYRLAVLSIHAPNAAEY